MQEFAGTLSHMCTLHIVPSGIAIITGQSVLTADQIFLLDTEHQLCSFQQMPRIQQN